MYSDSLKPTHFFRKTPILIIKNLLRLSTTTDKALFFHRNHKYQAILLIMMRLKTANSQSKKQCDMLYLNIIKLDLLF